MRQCWGGDEDTMIQRCRTMFPLRLMCRLLQVSPSGFYARKRRSASLWSQNCQRLTAAIRTLHAERDGVYGSQKIWQILRKQNEGCGKHSIARLTRREGLRGISSPTSWKRQKSGERPAGITNQLAETLPHRFQIPNG